MEYGADRNEIYVERTVNRNQPRIMRSNAVIFKSCVFIPRAFALKTRKSDEWRH